MNIQSFKITVMAVTRAAWASPWVRQDDCEAAANLVSPKAIHVEEVFKAQSAVLFLPRVGVDRRLAQQVEVLHLQRPGATAKKGNAKGSANNLTSYTVSRTSSSPVARRECGPWRAPLLA